jgi:hypothetical protein
MKKTFLALVAGAIAVTATASAEARQKKRYVVQPEAYSAFAAAPEYTQPNYAPLATGAVVGTAVGAGLHNGWYGTTAANTALPVTAAGAAATGFVAGVGAVALIHAATTPCQGFHALFSGFLTSPEGCVNGQWVGRPARTVRYR